MYDDDNTQRTIYKCIGSMAFMPNEPKTKCDEMSTPWKLLRTYVGTYIGNCSRFLIIFHLSKANHREMGWGMVCAYTPAPTHLWYDLVPTSSQNGSGRWGMLAYIPHSHSSQRVSRIGWDEFSYFSKTRSWALNVNHKFSCVCHHTVTGT